MASLVCEICGNPIRPGTATCPFCGSRQESGGISEERPGVRLSQPRAASAGSTRFASCNIKQGLPTVEQAERMLCCELDRAVAAGTRVLTVVHGYGSSGRGGAIRDAARVLLRGKVACGQLRAVVPGEEFSQGHRETCDLLRALPWLRDHQDLGRANRGITVVVL
jgi:hypothetical protein